MRRFYILFILLFIAIVIIGAVCHIMFQSGKQTDSLSQTAGENYVKTLTLKKDDMEKRLKKANELLIKRSAELDAWLIKRSAELDACEAEFWLSIRGRGKTQEEIAEQCKKESSELKQFPWFLKVQTVWKNWTAVQEDVVIINRYKTRLERALQDLELAIDKLKLIEKNNQVYNPGEDLQLDNLISGAEVDLNIENIKDKLTEEERYGIAIEVDKSIIESIKKKVSRIPGLELASTDELPALPDIAEIVKEPEDSVNKSVYKTVVTKCNGIIENTRKKAEELIESKQPESACDVWFSGIDELNLAVINWGEDKGLNYRDELDVVYSKTLLFMSKPFENSLNESIKSLEGSAPDWETVVESLEGLYEIHSRRPELAAVNINEQLNIIREQLKYHTNANDFGVQVIRVRLESILEKWRNSIQKTFTVGDVEFVFRYCPAGTFMMGPPETESGRYKDETQHEVKLSKGFWIMETEVTRGMFEAFVADSGYESKGSVPVGRIWKQGWFSDSWVWRQSSRLSWTAPGFNQDGSHPVTCVSWNDAVAFCDWLSKQTGQKIQLPTEAQWEYACRAGSTTAFSWGDALNGDKANSDGAHPYGTNTIGRFLKQTTPVRSYAPNAWGLYDMHGNVREWCQDYYGDYPNQSVTNPTGVWQGKSRASRGGDWYGDSVESRSANRRGDDPAYRAANLGFRCSIAP